MKKERNSKLGYAKNGWLYKEKTAGYIFSAPFIFGFLFFVIVPVATSLYYAFCNYNILKPARWVGLKNFIDIFQDPTFYKALGVTLKFAFISVPLKLVFALIVALILLKGTKLTPFYRAAYYLPSILGSSVAVAILWKRMFAVDGLVNKLLSIQFAWLGSTTAALWVIILLAVWQFGSSMLIFLSAMKQIPPELYEAARVDGAGGIYSFFRITLPLLAPTIGLTLIVNMISASKVFSELFPLFNGQPGSAYSLYTVVYYLYDAFFVKWKLGRAAASAVILFAIVLVLTMIQLFIQRKWKNY